MAIYEKKDGNTVVVTTEVSKEKILRRRQAQVDTRTRADDKIKEFDKQLELLE